MAKYLGLSWGKSQGTNILVSTFFSYDENKILLNEDFGLSGLPGSLKAHAIKWEVRPFTRESLEKINLRTSNLIRDYGFLPRRSPNLLDGAQLPAKYEPFPPELLGKPIEEIDQYVYEKVRDTLYCTHC